MEEGLNKVFVLFSENIFCERKKKDDVKNRGK